MSTSVAAVNARLGRLVLALRGRRSLARCGFGIRQDWPDGTHTLTGIWPAFHTAERQARRDRDYWRRGPVRPVRWHIVVVTMFDVRVHARRRFCRDPACPTGPVIIGRPTPHEAGS